MKHRTISYFVIIAMILTLLEMFPNSPDTAFNANAAYSSNLSISDKGVELLCSLEGFSQYCYQDNTQSSIGYGTKCTGSSQQPHASGSHSITQTAAMSAMKSQLASTYEPNVRRQTSDISMTQNQYDALVSLCYNTGGGTNIISNSPLVKYLKGTLTKAEAKAAYQEYYITSGGVVLQGLINRRKKEAEYFFSNFAADTYFKVSSSSVTINRTRNEQKSIAVTTNHEDFCYFAWDITSIANITYTDKNVSDGTGINLIFTGVKDGSDTIKVKIYNDDDEVIDSISVSITVVSDAPSFTASASSVTLNRSKSEEKIISFTALNYDDIAFFAWDITEIAQLSGVYRSVEQGMGFDLTLSGIKNGTDTIAVKAYNSNEQIIASINLKITVVSDSVSFKTSSTSITINRSNNETKSITFTDNSLDPVSIELGSAYEIPIVGGTLDIGYNTHKHTLTLYGVRNGHQEMIIHLVDQQSGERLASITLELTVTSDTYLWLQPNNDINLEVGDSHTFYIDYINAPARYVDVSIQLYHDDGTCTYEVGSFSGDWQGDSIPVTVKGTAVGNEKLIVQLIDRESKEYFDGMYFNIGVTRTQTIYYNANGGFAIEDSKSVQYGEPYGALPEPTRTGYLFSGWYTSAAGGTRITADTVFNRTSDQILYAHWEAEEFTVLFAGNGGSATEPLRLVTYGSAYGTMPTAIWNGYRFEGWYTAPEGGSEVTGSDIVRDASHHTLYAHWSRYIGDVNADGMINSTDCVLLQKWLLGNANTKLPIWQNADLTGDEQVNAFDLALLKQQILNAS